MLDDARGQFLEHLLHDVQLQEAVVGQRQVSLEGGTALVDAVSSIVDLLPADEVLHHGLRVVVLVHVDVCSLKATVVVLERHYEPLQKAVPAFVFFLQKLDWLGNRYLNRLRRNRSPCS